MANQKSDDPFERGQQAAATLYDGNKQDPNTKQPLAQTAPKTTLHTHSVAESAARQRETDLRHQLGMDTPACEALYRGYRDLEAILPSGLAATVTIGDIDNKLAAARISDDPDADDVALAHRIKRDEIESRERITSQYGVKDGEQLLERAQRFARSHPKLAAILKERGLGSKPEIVEAIAAHVFSTGWR